MQKIMFNSKLGLEQAVLEGRKTMTRRSVSDKILNKYQDYLNWWNTQNGGFKVPEDEFYRCESYTLSSMGILKMCQPKVGGTN